MKAYTITLSVTPENYEELLKLLKQHDRLLLKTHALKCEVEYFEK